MAKAAKKKTALASAATKRLQKIGGAAVAEAHLRTVQTLLHMESHGEVQRVRVEDGRLAWVRHGSPGKPEVMVATPEMEAIVARLESGNYDPHASDFKH